MQLGTLGAILSYALELETGMMTFYQARRDQSSGAVFERLSKKAAKRVARIERLRREGITEMILEPIEGMDTNDYPLALDADTEGEMTPIAIDAERTLAAFYRAAAEKAPVGEVARALRRMKSESQSNLKMLTT